MQWKVIWIFLNIIVLLLGLYLRTIAPDGAIVFIYLIYFISFPIGLIVPFIFIYLDIYFNFNIYYESYPILIDIFIPWIVFLIAGYIQWFIIIPKIKNYLKKKFFS